MEQVHPPSTELEIWKDPSLQSATNKIGNRALFFNGLEFMNEPESQFAHMRAMLEKRIIDQPEAIDAIIEALDRCDVRLPNDKRPIANFAFLGQSGVGKSETGKALSELLAQHFSEQLGEKCEPNLIKIDCSNYSHGYEVSSLTGSPKGYIGSDTEGFLSKENVEKPGTVILFDEVEKGSQQLYNLLLQIMGDGELKMNNTGELTSFRNTVIILTSNLGSKKLANPEPFGLSAPTQEAKRKDLERTATQEFDKHFLTEFINRIHKKVVFHQPTPEGLSKILDSKLEPINRHQERYLGARITLSEGTKDYLVSCAVADPRSGARPLVQAFEENVMSGFARRLKAGDIPPYTHIYVFHKSEVPDDTPNPKNRELIFFSKRDETIQKISEEELAAELAEEQRKREFEEQVEAFSQAFGMPKEMVRQRLLSQQAMLAQANSPPPEEPNPYPYDDPETGTMPLFTPDDDDPPTVEIPVITLSDEPPTPEDNGSPAEETPTIDPDEQLDS